MTDKTSLRSSYDVVVAGAGPSGSAAAVGYARRGAKVLLIEANPKAAGRFAGEWLHPTSMTVIDRLGMAPFTPSAGYDAGRGFVVFPDDDSPAIKLDYPNGKLGASAEHHAIVGHFRRYAVEHPGVDYLEWTKVVRVEDVESSAPRVVFQRKGEAEESVTAGIVIGADGRSSAVRRSIRDEEATHPVSYMAGVLLEDVEMPAEGYGHVLLGGPGPILMYRVSETSVRACIDLPANQPGARRDARYLWDAFGQRFPAQLRAAFKRALATQPLSWASNRFLPRTFYGKGQVALVGDAVGFYHPLTASGITVGLKDVESLLDAPDVQTYCVGREPQSYVPELLSNALFHVFTREDASAASLRRAVYRTWRERPAERGRTMSLLSYEELRLGQFSDAFIRVAMQAVRETVDENSPVRLPAELARYLEWAQWPLASLLPGPLRRKSRVEASPAHPMRGLKIAPPAPDFPLPEDNGAAAKELDVDVLLAKVEAVEVPSTPASELVGAIEEADAGHVPLEQLAHLARRVFDLLEDAMEEKAGEDDRLARALPNLRALSVLRRTYPGLCATSFGWAFDGFVRDVRELQLDDGSFGGLAQTAAAVELFAAAETKNYDPALRRVTRHLALTQREDGRWGGLTTTALVVRAILRAGLPLFDAAERALESFEVETSLPAEAGEALEVYRDVRTLRPRPVKARRKSKAPSTAILAAPSKADRAYVEQALLAVSRTFARPIQMLEEPLRTAVSCGYLLCRIADTVEDDANFTMGERDERYHAFLEALTTVGSTQPADATEVRRFESLFDEGAADFASPAQEVDLANHLSTVMRVFRSLPLAMQTKTIAWVEEMTRGMQLYSHRRPGHDGMTALTTVEDLDRYCYFVAGTVGHMLTDLFVEAFGIVGTPAEYKLREEAEAFGSGLQFVNILKDVTDDRARDVSFIPRTVAASQGLALRDLTAEENRVKAHAAVAPLFDLAAKRLDRALEYTLAIPREQTAVRLFCLLPLWMAVRTLIHGRGNDAMFVAGEKVKISRKEVEGLIADAMAHVGDDEALRERYDALWRGPATPPSVTKAAN